MEIRQCFFKEEEELQQLVELQNEVYKERGHVFSPKGFKFWYVDNPEGPVISFNAFDNGKMVAHQSFVPEQMLVEGRPVRCLRSMAVVTHPDYRKRGLFSALTNQAVDEAHKQGYEFIYAITNENSFPAFIKYCGFSFVTRLNVKFGFGHHIVEDGEKTYKRFWPSETLQWRLSKRAYCLTGNSVLGKYSKATTYLGTLDKQMMSHVPSLKKGSSLGIRLYVGLGASLPWSYFDVPKFIKHSPFNVIFKDLTGGKLPPMTANNLFYQLMDYDVA